MYDNGAPQHGLVSLLDHLQLPKHCGSVAHQMEAGTYQIAVEPDITAPRTASRDSKRHKASNYKLG